MKNICVITATRAEFGLLSPLLHEINNDTELNLQLIVTGTHLSSEFGETYKEIEKEFDITKKIFMDLSSDTPLALSKTGAKLQIDMSETFDELHPDLIVILGDRYEMLSIATSAMMLNIPIAHIHGGETTEGAIDEAIRHAISKMSHIHFCATEVYKKRVIQLGEHPSTVYNVGALGVENIQKLQLLTKDELEQEIGFTFAKKNLLVTFHPVTLEEKSSKGQFQELLDTLEQLRDTHLIFTKANADADGKIINEMIEEFTKKHPNSSRCYASLGQLKFLSSLQFIDGIVGNSSSGIIEAPSFNIATINIGDRQKGRVQAQSIINTQTSQDKIKAAIEHIYTDEFQKSLTNNINPYQSDNTAFTMKEVIKKTPLENILKKKFFDL